MFVTEELCASRDFLSHKPSRSCQDLSDGMIFVSVGTPPLLFSHVSSYTHKPHTPIPTLCTRIPKTHGRTHCVHTHVFSCAPQTTYPRTYVHPTNARRHSRVDTIHTYEHVCTDTQTYTPHHTTRPYVPAYIHTHRITYTRTYIIHYTDLHPYCTRHTLIPRHRAHTYVIHTNTMYT